MFGIKLLFHPFGIVRQNNVFCYSKQFRFMLRNYKCYNFNSDSLACSIQSKSSYSDKKGSSTYRGKPLFK